VVAVVVTWNRRDLLVECLAAIDAQTLGLTAIVVVDNASTDGTTDLLDSKYGHLELVHLTSNIGGAGGFAAGIERALTLDPDLIWLLDDDTVPEPAAAERLADAWRRYPGRDPDRPRVLASRVVWTDGRDHPMNTPRPKPMASAAERADAEAVGCVPIRSASFVSIMCDAVVVKERGAPVADYFLWNDDFEYSTRLIRGGVGLYCPSSVVVHKTRTFGSTDADPGERFFYEVRNKVWLFTRSRGLSPAEKLLYGGATVRRWGRTFARSNDRRVLLRGLGAGLAAGFTRRPRSNGVVLSEAGWSPHEGVDAVPAPLGPQPFSLLLSVYGGDDSGFLRDAFTSSVHDQTRPPDQVVLTQDGPVPDDLAKTIGDLVASSPVRVDHVVLEDNVGLGPALDRGLAACDHEIVARMDADDISLPDRFEKQIPVIEAGADLDRAHRWAPYPTDRPGRDPSGHALPGPLQPPDRGLPTQRRPGRRRVHRHGADGGLSAVRADGRGRRAAGEPRRAAGLLPGGCRGVRAPRRAAAAPLGAGGAAPVPPARDHHAPGVRPQRRGPGRIPTRARTASSAGLPGAHREPGLRPQRVSGATPRGPTCEAAGPRPID
jgi:GT2 family glycosyltransferase